jgi:diaminopimelate epimerase
VRHLRTVKGEVDGELWTQVEMGEPGEGPPMTPEAIEFPSERRATVDIGNPHVVFLVPDPDAIDLSVHGPVLERSFPAGINVHMVAPTSFEDLELRVWERGVGITNACGSGAVAATVAAHGWGVIGTHATVHMPGGDAVVEIDGARALLTGPSAFIAEVVVP